MVNLVLLYLGAIVLFIWGIAHLLATRPVVKGFGNIPPDNRLIITMEWLVEGVTLIFIAALIFAVTYLDQTAMISRAVYALTFLVLNTLSLVCLLTGFKVKFFVYQLTPIIFTSASVLILLGSYI